MASEGLQKPIHSLILDTGPLIKNAVSISTIINSAEEIFTTPAIISEIRDEATRSRVQTTLMPFLKIRNPSPASYDAVIAFSKKTGDYAVLSRQDLGILALAYEVHCERNGGPWGLREAPKQPLKLRPGEEEKVDEETKEDETKVSEQRGQTEKNAVKSLPAAKRETREQTRVEEKKTTDEQTEQTQVEDEEEGFEIVKQRKGKKETGRKQKEAQRKMNKISKAFTPNSREQSAPEQSQTEQQTDPVVPGEVEHALENAATQDELTEQTPKQSTSVEEIQITESQIDAEQEQVEGHAATQEIHDTQQPLENTDVSGEAQAVVPEAQKKEDNMVEPEIAQHVVSATSAADHFTESHVNQTENMEEQKPTESEQHDSQPDPTSEDLSHDLSTLNIDTPPSPPATEDEDSDGDWITPSNLTDHQAKDSGLPQNSQTIQTQMDVATMTIDFAMQNVLLQMNLHLLSTNMQRIKNLTSKVLRCHACFSICRDMSKQFCPRCGGASLKRVNCSTNSKGEFRLHLAKNYQFNKRGDRYSVPKPIAGTANGKWNGLGGGQGGWGRDLILTEDQKERTKAIEEERRSKGARDLMDDDYLPGILTGDRSGRAGGRMKVGAGKNVNSKKRA
jgi:RNA-binding protein NOB1